MDIWLLLGGVIVLILISRWWYKYKMIQALQGFEAYIMMLFVNSNIYEDHKKKFDDFLKNEISRIPHEGANRFVAASRAIDQMAMGGEGNWHVIVQKHMGEL